MALRAGRAIKQFALPGPLQVKFPLHNYLRALRKNQAIFLDVTFWMCFSGGGEGGRLWHLWVQGIIVVLWISKVSMQEGGFFPSGRGEFALFFRPPSFDLFFLDFRFLGG